MYVGNLRITQDMTYEVGLVFIWSVTYSISNLVLGRDDVM
jgi:hypothetical protein